MKIFLSILISGICIVSMNACYYDKEELLYGNSGPCPDSSVNISYSQKVVPLLNQNCYGCHTGSFPSGGILMGTYLSDKVLAQNGKLYGTIAHNPGFSAMPMGMPKMNKCQITLIKKWIDTGMLNN